MLRSSLLVVVVVSTLLTLPACKRLAPAGKTPLAAGSTAIPAATPPPNGRAAPLSFAPIVAKVAPAVVSIDAASPLVQQITPFGFPGGQAGYQVASGSGFLISPDGYIATNNHVIAGARTIRITLQDKRVLPAKVVGHDEATDLAVLKIDGKNLPFVSFENSATPQVGDWVIAVGNPYGLGNTATAGIVSAYARDIGESYVSYLQIDAPINRGNSGGPSFDTYGRVIGVNTAIFSPSGGSIGIGFAIPADLAANIIQQLMKTGHVTRGYLGAGVQDLTPATAEELGVGASQGALIGQVSMGGPAAQAGLRPGDVIVAVDGQGIAGARELIRKVAAASAGTVLKLDYLRGSRRASTSARIAQRTS
jgi:serine protease Do